MYRYFKTPYVDINLQDLYMLCLAYPNFKTPYVDINHKHYSNDCLLIFYFKTPYVDINHFADVLNWAGTKFQNTIC